MHLLECIVYPFHKNSFHVLNPSLVPVNCNHIEAKTKSSKCSWLIALSPNLPAFRLHRELPSFSSQLQLLSSTPLLPLSAVTEAFFKLAGRSSNQARITMPSPTLYTRRRRTPSPHPHSSAPSTSSAISITQSGQSPVQSPPSAPPSTPTSHVLEPITTTGPRRARHPARPPPAVPFYPDIRRRLRYRNNTLPIGIAAQKNRLIQRLLLYCPRLSGDLCSILCTCENTLEHGNPWLSASWVPLADTDTKSAVYYVPSPNHSHTWVMTPDGLKEAAEVLEAVMKYDMPNSIHQQFTEAAHTLAQIYQALQAEMRLYSGRYGAGRELHTKWEIHWNKNEQEEKEWKEVKYQQILKDRKDVQAGRRHVMQTTGMTEEEIVQRARTPSRKRMRSSSSTGVPTMEVEEQPVTLAPPMRTYYQRPGFANRSGAAADWLSEIPIANEPGTTPAPTEASQRTQTTAGSAASIENGGWVNAEDAARAAAIMYTRQQALGAPRMPFAQWVRFAHSLRPEPTASGPVSFLPQPNHNQSQMNVGTHPPAASQGVQNFGGQAVTAMNGQSPQVMEANNGTVLRQEQQLSGQSRTRVVYRFVPSPDAAGRAALERLARRLPLIEGPPLFPVDLVATTAATAPNTAISERQQLRARTVSLVNRGTARRVRNGRSSLARNRDVDLRNWARPESQARTDDAAMDNNRRVESTASSVATTSTTLASSEEQTGTASTAAGAMNRMSQSWQTANPQPGLARPQDAAVRESDTALLSRYRAVLAEEEQEMRSGGRTLLERRADRRRANGHRAPPRALDVAVTDFVRQRDRARVDGTVSRRSQRAGRGRSVFNSNTSSESDEDAFWWQGTH